MTRRFSRIVALAAVMVCSLLVSVPTAASADTGTPPVLQDIFGGPLHAEMYPSGLEVDSAGNVVIADTGNNQVAKYAPNGTQLWRIGEWGDATNEFDNPRDIAIDAADNIYVMDTRNSRVVKLSPSGAWLDTYLGPVGDLLNFSLGVTIHDEHPVRGGHRPEEGAAHRRLRPEGSTSSHPSSPIPTAGSSRTAAAAT